MSKVLTFDLGTTYFKVCIFNEAAELVARARIQAPVTHPSAGRVVLPVTEFCRCLTNAVRDAARQAGGLADVSRISFASQANTFTLLDKGNRPLLPFILWSDERARSAKPPLGDLTSQPGFFQTTGVPALDHQFLPAKIAWLLEFEPHILSEARRICSISDYLVWWLTGEHMTEGGLAGLTGLVDIHRLEYWSEALQELKLSTDMLPEIARAGWDVGPLCRQRLEEFGVAKDCRLIMGCLDQHAGALGAGNVEPGGVSETTGTVLATIHCTDSALRKFRPGIFSGPSFAVGTYYEMVFSEISAGLLEQYRNMLPDKPSFAELDQLAAAVPAGAEGLSLHPDAAHRLVGEMFTNRGPNHHRGHEVRAILEAVALELRRQVDLLCGKRRPKTIRAAGGGARSKLWLEIKSATLGCPVQAVECSEPTSLGAAMLALGRIPSSG